MSKSHILCYKNVPLVARVDDTDFIDWDMGKDLFFSPLLSSPLSPFLLKPALLRTITVTARAISSTTQYVT